MCVIYEGGLCVCVCVCVCVCNIGVQRVNVVRVWGEVCGGLYLWYVRASVCVCLCVCLCVCV